MKANTASSPRLNPFAFPSDTTLRFLLLILSVLAAGVFAYNWIYFGLTDRTREVVISARCSRAMGPIGLGTSDAPAYARRTHQFQSCIQQVNHPKGYWILGGTAALLLLAVAFYLLTPRWKLWRNHLVPLDPEDAPDVVSELEALSRQAGFATGPRFVWNPLNRAATGLAFGRLGRYHVALGGGLVTTWYTDREAFRAVVLHELGHLKNRDVDRTYFTMSLWYAFLLAAVIPLIVTLLDDDAGTIWGIGWRLLALVALVYLTRNAVLRAREVYADLRADLDGAGAIRRLIAGLPGRPRHAWQRLLRVHPDPALRVTALGHTDALFQLGRWEVFGAGVVLTLVYHELLTLVGFYETDPFGSAWIAALLVAPFVAGVVGLGIWREGFADVVLRAPSRGVWKSGLALGLGALAGEALSFQNLAYGNANLTTVVTAITASGVPPAKGIIGSNLLGPGVLWAVAIVASMVALVWWTASGARLWLRRGGERQPRAAAMVGLTASAIVLTVWTGIFFLAYTVSAQVFKIFSAQLTSEAQRIADVAWIGPEQVYRLVNDPQILYVASQWPVLAALIIVWAFPLAAGLSVREQPLAPSWAFLGRHAPVALVPPTLQLRRALVVGVGAGLLMWIATLALRAGLHAWTDPELRAVDDFKSAFQYWNIGLSLALQAVAAALAACLCRHAPILHALLAAFVAGVVSAAGYLLAVTIGSCVAPFSLAASAEGCPFWVQASFARQVFRQILVEGMLIGLATSALVVGITSLRSYRSGADLRTAEAVG